MICTVLGWWFLIAMCVALFDLGVVGCLIGGGYVGGCVCVCLMS